VKGNGTSTDHSRQNHFAFFLGRMFYGRKAEEVARPAGVMYEEPLLVARPIPFGERIVARMLAAGKEQLLEQPASTKDILLDVVFCADKPVLRVIDPLAFLCAVIHVSATPTARVGIFTTTCAKLLRVFDAHYSCGPFGSAGCVDGLK
jgi:hypothetical protein